MKVIEAFYQVLKFPVWLFVFIMVFVFVIYGLITLPWKEAILHDIRYLPILLLIAVLIFHLIVNSIHFLEFRIIRNFKNRLQQFKLKMKFLLFCFSFQGEYENKKFEINIFQEPAWPLPNWKIFFRLYNTFPFKITIEKNFLKKIAEKLGLFQKQKLGLINSSFEKNYYIKTNNPTEAKFYLEREGIQKVLEELIGLDLFGKVEISDKWVQTFETRAPEMIFPPKKFLGLTFSDLFKSVLSPTQIIATLEKLNILTK